MLRFISDYFVSHESILNGFAHIPHFSCRRGLRVRFLPYDLIRTRAHPLIGCLSHTKSTKSSSTINPFSMLANSRNLPFFALFLLLLLSPPPLATADVIREYSPCAMPSRDRTCTYVHARKGQASLRRLSLFRESGGEAAAEATARSEAEDAARLAQLERQRQEEQRRQIQD